MWVGVAAKGLRLQLVGSPWNVKKKKKKKSHHLREGVVVTEALATYCHGVFSLLSIIFVDHRRNLVWLEIFGL